jgi:uncharacterized membrane protein
MSDPLTLAIDKTEDLLGHSPHPAVVLLPLGAWTTSNILDGMALASGDHQFDDAARWSMGIGLVGAVAAAATGLRDYGRIEPDAPSHATATTHALGNAVVGALFATSYIIRTKDHGMGRPTRLSARLLAFAGGALSMYTAWLGGVLVENYGESVESEALPYILERQGGGEQWIADHEELHGRDRLDPAAPLGRHHDADVASS